MTSAGKILRTGRERQGLSAAQVALALNITEGYLVAIEEDQIQALPGEFFYKSFARQYAGYVGVEVSQITPGLVSLFEPAPASPEKTLPSTGLGLAPGTADTVVPAVGPARKFTSFVRDAADRLRSPRPSPRSAVGGVITVLMLASAGVAGWVEWPKRTASRARKHSTPSAMDLAAQTDRTTETAASQAADLTSPLPVLDQPTSATASSQASLTTPPSPQVPNAGLKVTALETTWIALANQGKMLFSGTMQAGESKVFEGLNRATLKIGNAGGVQVDWNGQATGTLGRGGDVRTVLFNPDGFEILTTGGNL